MVFRADYAVGNRKGKGRRKMNQLFQDSGFLAFSSVWQPTGIGMLLKLKTDGR